MEDQLPQFRYHSDPFATDTFLREAVTCELCGKHRAVRYDGPIFGLGEAETICPWCIADGTAAEAGYSFVDLHGSGMTDPAIVSELSQRTPGFTPWQGATWCYHCDDACNYVGSVGRPELDDYPPQASEAVRATLRDRSSSEDELTELFEHLDKLGHLSVYLFECLHCGAYVARSDMD